MPDCWGDAKMSMDDALHSFKTDQPSAQPVETMIDHVRHMSSVTAKQQLSVLCSISNWPKWHHVNVSGVGQRTTQNTHFSQHLQYDPQSDYNENGVLRQNYIPTSPRNRLMYFLKCDDQTHSFMAVLRKLLEYDRFGESVVPADTVFRSDFEIDDSQPPPEKRRRRRRGIRAVAVPLHSLSRSVNVEESSVRNSAQQQRNIFIEFMEQMASDTGTIQWRFHDADEDVVVMSDINPLSGSISPNSFVHVSALIEDEGELFIKCTCAIYETVQRAAKQEIDLFPTGVEVVLDKDSTCMHCRLYREKLVHCIPTILDTLDKTTLPPLFHKVYHGLDRQDTPILLLGDVFHKGTTKFSVKGDSGHSMVHLTYFNGKYSSTCLNGMCKVMLRNKKKVSKSITLDKCGDACSHLKALITHFDFLSSLFPEGSFDDSSDAGLAAPPAEVENLEDAGTRPLEPTWFDVETGFWQSKSLSQHQPKQDQFDENLVR